VASFDVPNSQTIRFTDEEIGNFVMFAKSVERVYRRLIASGYTLVDGKFIPPPAKTENMSICQPKNPNT